MSSNMGATCNDYEFWDFPTVIAGVYIGLSVTSVILNFTILAVVFKSKRILGSPKYWVVAIISITFIFQSGVPNNILAVKWLTDEDIPNTLWKMSIIVNRYIGMAIASWGSVLINIDFALSMKSIDYTRNYRAKCILILMSITCAPAIAAVLTICALRDTDAIDASAFIDTFNHKILLLTSLFAPLALSILCYSVIMIWRCNSWLQKTIESNKDASKLVDTGDCPFLPPSDHLMFYLILILFYVPSAILTYEPLWPEECSPILTFLSVCTALRDNTGCIAPLAWFLFKDIRIVCKTSFTRRDGRSESLESRMHIHDSYPYCTRI